MDVVMQCIGGPLDGHHEFQDNDDIIPRVRYTQKVDQDIRLCLAMLVYHFTNGEVGKSTQGIAPAVFQQVLGNKLTDDLESAGQQYEITSRDDNADSNTVTIVAKCVSDR